MDEEYFKKKFPKLFQEVESSEAVYSVGGVRWSEQVRDELFNPDVFSFLRRCDTDEQGLEIIDYLEKRGELEKQVADDLRQQIKTNGIRSLGSKKDWGYYERVYR
ncbi:MAG: DUF2095 family protein [Candidatus Odinarchaeota archaeon]